MAHITAGKLETKKTIPMALTNKIIAGGFVDDQQSSQMRPVEMAGQPRHPSKSDCAVNIF
ncbi:MAG: hypothetical protein FWG10_09495 [Eubacteriaceae bacterium]|nr:hypothetical protein [Eubacteriaceae bacterium]